MDGGSVGVAGIFTYLTIEVHNAKTSPVGAGSNKSILLDHQAPITKLRHIKSFSRDLGTGRCIVCAANA
jgi:hypothetical protein